MLPVGLGAKRERYETVLLDMYFSCLLRPFSLSAILSYWLAKHGSEHAFSDIH
jgi:hypothetical protein